MTISCAQYRALAGTYVEAGLDEKHVLNQRITYYSRRWVCEDISVKALQEWLNTQEEMDAWEKLCAKSVPVPPPAE